MLDSKNQTGLAVMRASVVALAAMLALSAAPAFAAPICTKFTIKEPVPRMFEFEIQNGEGGIGDTFLLDSRSDSGDGVINCTRVEKGGADCRVSEDSTDPVVVKLKLESSDPEDMGSIETGFEAGDFRIGKGGWTLKCHD